jgi:heparan-sulfate lyase
MDTVVAEYRMTVLTAAAVALIMLSQMLSGGQYAMADEERLDQKRLFSLLDLDTPGMEKIKIASEAEDFLRARVELLSYMRNRENVKTQVPWRERTEHKGKYASQEDMDVADDALRHIFGGHVGDNERLFPAHDFGPDICWAYNPVKDREWIWHLNMMHFWRSLARAYWHTGDEKYAQEFFRQIDDWITKNPPDGNMTTWRKIDAGIRAAGPWQAAYFYCLSSPSLTPYTHTRILLGFYEHGAFLHSRPFSHENHGLFEARGLLFVSVLFPEFSEAAAWREKALGHLTDQIVQQVASDGGHMERCPSYHRACIHIFESAWDLARLNDVQIPQAYANRLEKMYEFSMFTSLLDGTAPRIGDTWHEPVSGLLMAGAKCFQRKDIEYVASSGTRGTTPEQTSICLEASGFCVMRDGWDEKSQYLLMKWRHGGWHSHFDDLSIILAFGGRILLDDSSTIDYHGGGRPKSRATSSHSTIGIEGMDRPSGSDQTRLRQWFHSVNVDYVDASGPATQNGHIHRRRIAYIRGKFWVLVDDVHGQHEGTDRVDMYFQFAPGEVKLDRFTARTGFRDGANLMVKEMEIPELTAHQEEGWIAVEYKVVKPRSRIRFSVNKVPVKLVSLLYPYEGEEPHIDMAELTLSRDNKDIFGLCVIINDEEHLIFFAPDGYEFSYQNTTLKGPIGYLYTVRGSSHE